MRALLAAPLLLAAAACATGGRPAGVSDEPVILDVALINRDGRIDLPWWGAGTVRMVDLWATWCQPCVVALPAYEGLYERYRDKPFELVALSLDGDRKDIDRFLETTKISFPVAWDPNGAQAGRAVQIEMIPTTLLLDCKGHVRHVHKGFPGPQVVETLQREIEDLLDESSCAAEGQVAR